MGVRRDRALDVMADAGMDGDAHLIEARQRATADTVDHDRIDGLLGKYRYRTHAPALFVGRVLDYVNLDDRITFDLNNREVVAATKMP